jgi:hypothetical protein
MHRSLRQWDAAVREAYAAQQSESAPISRPVFELTISRCRSTFQPPLMPVYQCSLVSYSMLSLISAKADKQCNTSLHPRTRNPLRKLRTRS